MSERVAGRELDAEVAEKVMGWTCRTFPDGIMPEVKHWSPPSGETQMLPGFSANIAAAWQVVERLLAGGSDVDIEADAGGYRCVVMDRTAPHRVKAAHADTPALAICLAALDAVQAPKGAHDAP